MPCNSEYMEPNDRETELSKVRTLLDEISGKPFVKQHWDGFHPLVYCKTVTKATADKWVAELCALLTKSDVKKYSLEMQIWWRDHQKWDKKRKREEKEAQDKHVAVKAALAKLTKEERRLLGFK